MSEEDRTPLGSGHCSTEILVVDDSTEIRYLAALALTHAGYRVTAVACGEAVVARLGREGGPGMVILDVEMPGISGFETLARIRADAMTAPIPVVMCTGRNRREDMLVGWSLGCDGYVLKTPGFTGDLIHNVRQVLGRTARERRAVRQAQIARLYEGA